MEHENCLYLAAFIEPLVDRSERNSEERMPPNLECRLPAEQK